MGTHSYHMLGPFANNQYVSKTWSGLNANHYQITVLYSYGLLGSGTWTSDNISLIATDSNGQSTISTNQLHSCTSGPFAVSGCAYTQGCFVNYQFNFPHSTDSLTLRVVAQDSTMSLSINVNAWSIKDLQILLHLCHHTCQTCTNSLFISCTSCIAGLYLQGGVCVSSCQGLASPVNGLCTASCSFNYFLNTQLFC